jgi:hypothetical protein
MIYGMARNSANGNVNYLAWTQANNLGTIAATLLWQAALYAALLLLGVMINLIFYRSNKLVKVIVAVSPVLLLMFFINLLRVLPQTFGQGVSAFISGAFGWESRNPFIAVLSFLVLAALFSGVSFLLLRRAAAKE